jgi:hypothetical protein
VVARPPQRTPLLVAFLALALIPITAFAHGVAGGDQLFIEQSAGLQFGPFVYLGAKHMVTGYDHLLFLVGVIFFLYRMRDVAIYVSLFAVGHSATLLYGVLSGTHVNPFFVDAIIGLSVVYKGLDNLGVFERRLGFQPNTKAAVLIFGLVHGFGLATKLQDFKLSEDGLVANIIGFNVGVELGQLIALGLILIGMGYWRRTASFERHAKLANYALVIAGLALAAYQVLEYMHHGGTP